MRKIRCVIYIFVLLLFTASGCLGKDDFATFTCNYCGKGGLSETELNNAHGNKDCVSTAPCGVDGHYVLVGKKVDKDGVDHSIKCTICDGYVCTGEHGTGICDTQADGPSPNSLSEQKSSDATLKEMSISVPSIDGSQKQIELSVEQFFQALEDTYFVGDAVSITATPNDASATVTGAGSYTLAEGENLFTVTVTAEDGASKSIYNISIKAEKTPAASGDCTLSSFYITFPDNTVIDMKDPDLRKTISVFNMHSATVTAVASDPSSQISGDIGSISISVGDNAFSVKVTAANGDTASFYYNISMATVTIVGNTAGNPSKSSDATLKNLALEVPDVGSWGISPGFSSDVYAYGAECDESSITIIAVANHSGANVSGDGTHELNPGNNTFTITVTAEDGVTTKTYTVVVTHSDK